MTLGIGEGATGSADGSQSERPSAFLMEAGEGSGEFMLTSSVSVCGAAGAAFQTFWT